MSGENFGRVGEVVTSLQRDLISFGQLGTLRELGLDPVQRVLHRAVVEPVKHAESKEVFGAINLFTRELYVALEGVHIERCNRQFVYAIAGERIVLQRV